MFLLMSSRLEFVFCIESESEIFCSLSIMGLGPQVHVTHLVRQPRNHQLVLQITNVRARCLPRSKRGYIPIGKIFWLPLGHTPPSLGWNVLLESSICSTNMISSVSVGTPVFPSVSIGEPLLDWLTTFCQLLQHVSSIGWEKIAPSL